MEILADILDVNFNLSTTLQLYIAIFFIITTIILFIHIKPVVNKLNNKTPFYWFVALMAINLLNIIFTYYHYNRRTNTFKGVMGPSGDSGKTGIRGDLTKCTTCDELISLDIHRRYDVLQNIYVDGNIGEVRRPFTRFGFHSLGDMVITKSHTVNKKRSYVVSGPMVKQPEDYNLIVKIPIIKGKVSRPVYIWRPIPPPNYGTTGDIITDNGAKPPPNACVCLPLDCLRPIDSGIGYSSWKFLYQNMRSGKEEDYIFCSFWDTPLNTFYCNFPDFQQNSDYQTFLNGNLYYNIVGGNPNFVKYNKVKQEYLPVKSYEAQLTKLFKSIVSPIDLEGNRQNIGGTGYLINLNKHQAKKTTNLWDALQKHFPGGYSYMISIDGAGDIRGGARLNKIQKKIIKYTKAWITPGKPMYVIHNKCLMKERISVERKEVIARIKRIYKDILIIVQKYATQMNQLKDYLSNHFDRLHKQMRHLPDYHQKVSEQDFTHFGLDRLKSLERELKNIHQAILNMTNEVDPKRRNKYFNLIKALKNYDNVKLEFDESLSEKECNQDRLKNIQKKFYELWDKLRLLYLTHPNFKQSLKNREFDGISDSKLEKTTNLFNDLSREMKQFAYTHCE